MTSSNRRRFSGAFYTPRSIVRYIVRASVEPLLRDGRDVTGLSLLDPACGDGAFLDEAARYFKERQTRPSGTRTVAERVCGVDIDAEAVLAARQRLARRVNGSCDDFNQTIRHGDALVSENLERQRTRGSDELSAAPPVDWASVFPMAFANGGFDIVVGNPPYVNVRILTKSRGAAVKEYFKTRFRCAQRAYDLYVLFIEQAYNLLRPGGICGMIVPNKIAEMEYAQQCRELLVKSTTLLEVVDVSSLKLFADASVFPYIIIWRKTPAPRTHQVVVRCVAKEESLAETDSVLRIKQHELSAEAGFDLHGGIDVESRVVTQPLSNRATLSSGTTGFVATQLADEVIEREEVVGRECHDFIVSGNIDRFAIKIGDVRFMKRRFQRPALPKDSALLSSRKRRLFCEQKIVVAGMTRRLEAAWDSCGLALGVQVYAVAQFRDDPLYVLGLLNSKLMSYLFRVRFHAKRLSGGYFAVNKRQLEQLPIRVCEDRTANIQHRISHLVRHISKLHADQRRGPEGRRIDADIDRLVYETYAVSVEEVEIIEAEVGG